MADAPQVSITPEQMEQLQTMVAHLTCNLCGERSTNLNPMQANIWIQEHLANLHPGEAAEMLAIDKKIKRLNTTRDRLIQKFSQRLQQIITSEAGRIVTAPPNQIIRPS